MRGNQAVDVVAGWAYFHSREKILKFPWKYSQWSSQERAFAVEAYFSNKLFLFFVIATQRAFQNRFNVAPRDPVPDRKYIVK